jgi:hypothetical protein
VPPERHVGKVKVSPSPQCFRHHGARNDSEPCNANIPDHFPYEDSIWEPDIEKKRTWYEALERTGPESVQARLVQDNSGSGSAIAIGRPSKTKGFVQERLAWQDCSISEREVEFAHLRSSGLDGQPALRPSLLQ